MEPVRVCFHMLSSSTYKLLGSIANEKDSSTEGAFFGFESTNVEQIMAIAILISTMARFLPGQNRGPKPNGKKAFMSCPFELLRSMFNHRSGSNFAAALKYASF